MQDVNPALWRCGALLAATAATVVVVGVDWESPARTAIAVVFMLFVPGLALTEMLAIDDGLLRLALATAASLAVETIAGLALLYADAFDPEHALRIVAAVTVLALALALLRERQVAQ